MSTQTPVSPVPTSHRITFFTATWGLPCGTGKQRLEGVLGKGVYEECVDFVDVDDACNASKMAEYSVEHIPILVFHQGAEAVVVKNASNPQVLDGAAATWLACGAAAVPMSKEATVLVAGSKS